MANQSISDEFFQAMDIIAEKRISELQYDQTLVCTITDTSNADCGQYTVSDTSSSFIAYSDNTNYLIGTKVYVTVPNGDMNNQKMIIGKYVSEEDENFFDYIPPLDDFINITDNIIEENIFTSLLANKGINNWSASYQVEFQENYPDLYNNIKKSNSYKKTLWSWSSENSDLYLANFDRLGISAEFKTSLKSLGATSGTYGLGIECEVETTSTVKNKSKQRYCFYFDSTDFFGNPYNFGTYYQQQKLFDLSDIMINSNSVVEVTNSVITAISIFAFQNQDFADSNDILLPFLKEDSSKCELLPDNIWVRNINLCFGFALEDYPDGQVILGCRNGLTYKPTTGDNNKELYIQWALKDDNSKYTAINDTKEFKEMFPKGKVHWYKYWMADDVSNPLAGAFWVELLTKKESEKYKDKDAILGTLIKEKDAGRITEDVYNSKVAQATTQANFLKSQDYRNLESENSFVHDFLPDISAQKEQLKVIIETKTQDSIIEELESDSNKELKDIYDRLELLKTNTILESGGRKYEGLLQDIKNAVYVGTELAFQLVEAKYDGSSETEDTNNKQYYPLYMGGNEEIMIEPDPSDYKTVEDFHEAVVKYKSYLERTETIEDFNKAKDCILSAYAENIIYTSEVLTLSNEVVCPNIADVDLVQGLSIIVDPEEDGGYEGIYLIYGEDNTLLNRSESTKSRNLTASYKSYITGEDSLDKASKIEWYIPLTNTMIQKPENGIEYNSNTSYDRAYEKWKAYQNDPQCTEEEIQSAKESVEKALKNFLITEPSFTYNQQTLEPTGNGRKLLNKYVDTYVEDSNGYFVITRNGSETYEGNVGDAQQIDSKQVFRIKNYYSPFATNNTIYCKVTKNNLTYEASVLLTFGIAGSNGTDATFMLSIVNYDDEKNIYTPTSSLTADFVNGKYSGGVHIIPHLYDYNNKEVDLKDVKIKYSWYSGISTSGEIAQKASEVQKESAFYSSIQRKYEEASDSEKEKNQTFEHNGAIIETTLKLMLEQAKQWYEAAQTAYEEMKNSETGAYYIDFTKDEDGKKIQVTEGSDGVDLVINDLVKSDPSLLCHAILQATIDNYEVTNQWVAKKIKSGNEEIGQVDSEGNPVLERTTKKVSLIAYLPISISFSEFKKVESPAIPYSIIYDANGVNPSYYKNNFELFDKYNNKIKDVGWSYYIQEESADNTINYYSQFYPTLKTSEDGLDYAIMPQTMFFSDTTGMGKGYSIIGSTSEDFVYEGGDAVSIPHLLWIQPILIIQNRYGSAMLNSWDGNLVVDEDNNTIMSAMVGAGIKNSDNSFSGVLMGEVKSTADIQEQVGLYGFDHGSQSFGFRVDGTAFLGASGKGRIYFDGNTGIIKGSTYNKADNNGMLIDLNSGLSGEGSGSALAMYGHNTEDGGYQGVEIDTTSGVIFNLFAKDEANGNTDITKAKSLMRVGKNEYYLQTANFTKDDGGHGLKINLKDGLLTGYDFTLKAGKGNQKLTIESDADQYPFTINNKLKLAWDGTLSINDHFKAFPDGAIAISNELNEGQQYWFTSTGTDEINTKFPEQTDANMPKFCVTANGTLYAQNGYFGGRIAGQSIIAGDATVDGAFYIKGTGYEVAYDESTDSYYYKKDGESFIGPLENQIVGMMGYGTGAATATDEEGNTIRNDDGSYAFVDTYGVKVGNADGSKYILFTNAGLRFSSNNSYLYLDDRSAAFTFRDEDLEEYQLQYVNDKIHGIYNMEEGFSVRMNGRILLHSGNWIKYTGNVIAVLS